MDIDRLARELATCIRRNVDNERDELLDLLFVVTKERDHALARVKELEEKLRVSPPSHD